MIYLFYGSDAGQARTKAFAWVAAARLKQPNLSYVRLAQEELSLAALEEVVSSGGLFVRRMLVLIDDPFSSMRSAEDDERENEPAGSLLEEHVDALAASDNAIVILAPKLSGARAKKIISKAVKAYEFAAKKSFEEVRGFNAGLVNTLVARNREKLWLEIVRALRAGDAPEMLHGLLHWKARDILEKGSRSWKPFEARALSLALISLLQNSRRTGATLGLELEKFALSV